MFEPSLVDRLAIPLLFLDKPVSPLEPHDQRIELRLRRYGFERLHPQNKIDEVQRLIMGRPDHRFNDIIPQRMDDPAVVTNPLKNEFRDPAPSLLTAAASPRR